MAENGKPLLMFDEKIVLWDASKNTEDELEILNNNMKKVFVNNPRCILCFQEDKWFDSDDNIDESFKVIREPYVVNFSHHVTNGAHQISVVKKNGISVLMEELYPTNYETKNCIQRYYVAPCQDVKRFNGITHYAKSDTERRFFEADNRLHALEYAKIPVIMRQNFIDTISELVSKKFVYTGEEKLLKMYGHMKKVEKENAVEVDISELLAKRQERANERGSR